MNNHPAVETALATPPTVTSAATLFGVPVSDWVLWLNAIYLVILIVFKLWGKYKEISNARKRDDPQ